MGAEFVTLAKLGDIDEGELAAFEVNGTKIALAHIDGTFYAFDDVCTHAGCSLAEGELEDATVTCPCHGSQLDVTTGAVISPPAKIPVSTYPVRLDEDTIQVAV